MKDATTPEERHAVKSNSSHPLPGTYRHYKGKEYEVIGVARHSETEEEFVVYRQCYGQRELWIRPKSMFMETVSVDGVPTARFTRVEVSNEEPV